MSSNQNGRRSVKGPTEQMKRRTLLLMAVCGIVAFGILVGRLYYLQIVRHEDYQRQAASQQMYQGAQGAQPGQDNPFAGQQQANNQQQAPKDDNIQDADFEEVK